MSFTNNATYGHLLAQTTFIEPNYYINDILHPKYIVHSTNGVAFRTSPTHNKVTTPTQYVG